MKMSQILPCFAHLLDFILYWEVTEKTLVGPCMPHFVPVYERTWPLNVSIHLLQSLGKVSHHELITYYWPERLSSSWCLVTTLQDPTLLVIWLLSWVSHELCEVCFCLHCFMYMCSLHLEGQWDFWHIVLWRHMVIQMHSQFYLFIQKRKPQSYLCRWNLKITYNATVGWRPGTLGERLTGIVFSYQ